MGVVLGVVFKEVWFTIRGMVTQSKDIVHSFIGSKGHVGEAMT